jgi:hypothetical protein
LFSAQHKTENKLQYLQRLEDNDYLKRQAKYAQGNTNLGRPLKGLSGQVNFGSGHAS